MTEQELEQRLAALDKEPDVWVRENARGVLLGEQCHKCLAHIITGRPAPRRKTLCARCAVQAGREP